MRKVLCGVLFFSIACAADLYAQASFKLLENNTSPTLNAAVEAHKRKDWVEAVILYKQCITEIRNYVNKLPAEDSILRQVTYEETDLLHFIYDFTVWRIQEKEQQEKEPDEQTKSLLFQFLNDSLNYMGTTPVRYAHLLTLGAYLADNPTIAESYHLNAIQIYKEQLGDQHITYADEVSRLAHFYLEKRELQKAEELLLSIIPVFQAYYDKLDWDYVSLLMDLGEVYAGLYNWEKAVRNAYDLIGILKKIEYKDVSLELLDMLKYVEATVPLIGFTLFDVDSASSLDKMPNITTDFLLRNLGGSSDEYIYHLILNGYRSFKDADIEDSNSFYEKAAELEKERNGVSSPVYEEIQSCLKANATKEGRIHRLKKDLNEQKSKQDGVYSHETMDLNLALFRCYSDDVDSASYYLSEYQKILTKQIEDRFPFFIDDERERWWKVFSINLLLFKFSAAEAAVLNHVYPLYGYTYNADLFSKSILSTSSQKLRQAIFSSDDPQLISEWNQLCQLKKELNPANELLISQLERNIVKKTQTHRDKSPYFDIEWTDIKESLLPGEAAIEFSTFIANPEGEFQKFYIAFLIRPDYDYPEFVWEVTEDELIEAIHSENTNALYEVLWLPIEQYLEKGDVIYLAPAGLLHSISFGGISYKNGNRYLCEDYTIHNLLSTRDMVKLKEKNDNVSRSKQIALFGGADYLLPVNDLALLDKDVKHENISNLNRRILDEMDSLRGPGFAYLPGTKREVQQINEHLSGLNWKTSLFTDHNATEARFKSLASGQSPEVIHISTHGFYFPQSQIESPSEKNVSNAYRLADNPLMRSGLAFAGANHVWKGNDPITGTDDGILTAYEISNLNLFNTELVVLSACNTGLGDVDFSEGVYGLQRAFRLAGVETMIVSLWEVPDKETVELMTRFYSFWGTGLSKKEAFDKAQLEMRYAYPDQPQKWAGFIMIE